MIHVLLRYIGIKTKLIDKIKEQIDLITPKNGCILDLFAGSTIVGQSLMDDYVVYSNDIQQYSCAVAKATLKISSNIDYSLIDYKKIIESDFFKHNLDYLKMIFKNPYSYEKDLLNKLKTNEPDLKTLLEFKNYYDNTPYLNNYNDKLSCFKDMEKIYSFEFYNDLKKTRKNYALFCINYACPYFSIKQAMFIDSYRFALDKLKENKIISQEEYYIYLSMLIYYVGNIVTSVGDHYAQPQRLKISSEKRLQREVIKIIKKKTLDVEACFKNIQEEFQKITYKDKNKENKVFCCDYKDLFEEEFKKYMEKVDTIYIDPPYTNAHYSRFYHILETLVKYDYPNIEFFGRYRNDRYQSPFCIKSQAGNEFDNIIKLSNANKKNLVISYSDTSQCIITKNEIIEICKKYYNNVLVNEIDYLYRNFGQKPNKVTGNELLIICQKD
ncbi:MAG: DNA adenine methylase [Candidatus Gastranaerophilales bacterium]|nr:DNA adenine methylase [Candidatus Gastranaerophilales bacterium]